ncbi:MAG TPA: hypothetical protein VKU19_02410 [Bryobacteraceae bacterium]|nr:hypothetical protein [Bryobacteraceae bacterium]
MNQHIAQLLRAGCLCIAVTLPSAFAQPVNKLTVDVPFSFQVNNQQFPAGKYDVKASASETTVLLRSADCKRATFSFSNGIDSAKPHAHSALVFRTYGNQHFLSQILLGGGTGGRSLPMSRAEREYARNWEQSANEAVAVARPPEIKR